MHLPDGDHHGVGLDRSDSQSTLTERALTGKAACTALRIAFEAGISTVARSGSAHRSTNLCGATVA